MKRFTLVLVLMCSVVLAFGQKLLDAVGGPANIEPVNPGQVYHSPLKGGGDLIWGTSFDWENPADPHGWTLPAGWTAVDNSDLGNYWIWRKDTISYRIHRFAPPRLRVPPSWFTTADDGYICLPIDDYNFRDGVATTSLADSYIQTPPIDCSAASSVVVKFNQFFIYCCSNYNLELQVTNDGGTHWATYDVKFNVSGNIATPEQYGRAEFNISDVAAGSSTVVIRFYMYGFSYYFWAVDDLRLTEAFDNELVLTDTWMDFDGGEDATIEAIHFWPKSQMGMPGSTSGTVGNYYFTASIYNIGSADAENARFNLNVLKNGTEIYSGVSPASSVWSRDRDTLKIADPWLATDFGDYRFDFTAVADNGDEVPENNSASMYFTVNDTLGHRADFSAEAEMNTSGWVNGGRAGDMVAVYYNLYAAAEINSITAYLTNFFPAEAPQFQFVLMKNIDGTMEEWLISDVVDMDSSYRMSWVTLPLSKDGETEFLEPGEYATCVRMWGDNGTTTGSQGMFVGRDLTSKFSGCPQYYTYDAAWHNLAGSPLPMIGFNINETGGPTQAPVTFNVDMNRHIANGEFHPGTDFLDVAGSFNNWSGSAHLTDPEADGIYTITLDGMPVNKVIEYKYRINGNWNTSEYPNGGPNRKYTVRYWNILNDVYNSGKTTGIDATNLVASFSIYPNPNSGRFTIEVANPVASDLVITIVDVQGHVVYTNTIKGVVEYKETIDNQLPKGLYFLSVNNGREVEIQKVIIQ